MSSSLVDWELPCPRFLVLSLRTHAMQYTPNAYRRDRRDRRRGNANSIDQVELRRNVKMTAPSQLSKTRPLLRTEKKQTIKYHGVCQVQEQEQGIGNHNSHMHT